VKIKALRIIPMKEVPARFYDPERDGVTFSLLTTWKNCRERARLFLNGWTSKKNSLGLVFGGLVHGITQRMYEAVRDGELTELPSEKFIKKVCKEVEEIWKRENPRADGESLQYLEYSMILLEALMPEYFKYWKRDFSLLWSEVEKTFKNAISIEHPNGRVMKTFIRGKMDGAYRRKPKARPWLLETKSKSNLGERGESDIADILPHELQVNIYLLNLLWIGKVLPDGLLYNIIRRPGLRQKKSESIIKFARRVAEDVRKRPEWYFVRIQMSVSKRDLDKNELELRDMVSDFLLWWNGLAGHYKNSDACQNKYGVCAMLPICARGDYSGFYKRETVFRELADEL
jgi:hypothetical protein